MTRRLGLAATTWHPRLSGSTVVASTTTRADVGVCHNVCGPDFCDNGAMQLTLLIVDDHEEFRAAARALLQAEGFDVVGEAADATAALAAVRVLRPRIVLLDIQLPGRDGLEVAEMLADLADPPAVVLISGRDAATYGSRLTASRARGFLTKSTLSGAAIAELMR